MCKIQSTNIFRSVEVIYAVSGTASKEEGVTGFALPKKSRMSERPLASDWEREESATPVEALLDRRPPSSRSVAGIEVDRAGGNPPKGAPATPFTPELWLNVGIVALLGGKPFATAKVGERRCACCWAT